MIFSAFAIRAYFFRFIPSLSLPPMIFSTMDRAFWESSLRGDFAGRGLRARVVRFGEGLRFGIHGD